MTDRCHSPEEMAELASIPAGDLRRAHLESCPRCRAMLLSYLEFMDPGELPEEAKAVEAGRKLDAILRSEILEPDRRTERSGWVQGDAGREGGPGPFHRFRPFLGWPVLAPAAAVAAVAVILVLTTGPSRENAGGDLRGTEETQDALIPARAHWNDAGDLFLEWEPPEQSDHSVVVLYSADLSEIVRKDVGPVRAVAIPAATDEPHNGSASQREPGADSEGGPEYAGDQNPLILTEEMLYWRVLCFDGEREAARSALREIPSR